MPAIGDIEYGFDAAGVQEYLDNIKAIVLTQAAEALDNTDEIEAICNEKWEGQARDAFLENMKKDKEHVKLQFDRLYRVLCTEISNVQQVMADKDRVLID